MKTCIAAVMSLLFIVFSLQAVPAASPPGEAPVEAQTWLGLIDAGDYDQSWQMASGFFRTAVSQANWTASLQAARAPLGSLIARPLTTEQRANSLPGAPDGEYRILVFSSQFTHKKAALETLTLLREADGQWRAAGYFIK